MTGSKVIYRGTEMLASWPKKIQAAQKISTYKRNGVTVERVRYGSETEDWGANTKPCHDCCVIKGEYHVPGCDVERCPACGGQVLGGCECEELNEKNRKSTGKASKPFSKRQQQIVAARRNFKWRQIGFADNGDALFEVSNESNIRLPYLSIGVQGRGGTKLIGGAWLNVSSIEPGTSAQIQMDCYKDQLQPDELECFAKEDPTPETKDRYWEFKKL